MIIPDVNLLVYAYNADAPAHAPAKSWLEEIMNAQRPIGLPWVAILGFIRLMSHPKVLNEPLRPKAAFHHVGYWLGRAHVQILDPGPRHFSILQELLVSLGVAANLTTDAHLAAIAIEYQAELCSNDADFARFSGLRWSNPLC